MYVHRVLSVLCFHLTMNQSLFWSKIWKKEIVGIVLRKICKGKYSEYINIFKNTQQTINIRTLPQPNKGNEWKVHDSRYRQWWKTKSFTSMVKNKTRIVEFVPSIQHSIGSLSIVTRQKIQKDERQKGGKKRKRKSHANWKGSKSIFVYTHIL